MRDRLDIFIHIPKTGGTTFNRIIRDHYKPNQIAYMQAHPDWTYDRIIEKCKHRRSEIQIISGHYSFGIHERIGRPYRYITFLRDPRELLVSLYYYILQLPIHYLHQAVSTRTLNEFILDDQFNYYTSNLQSKRIGLANVFPDFLALQKMGSAIDVNLPDRTMVQKHLKQHFSFVGITEMYPASIERLSSALEWKNKPVLYRENINRHRKSLYELDTATINFIARKNSLDMELYTLASEQFTTSQ